jgi:hypothetical protein
MEATQLDIFYNTASLIGRDLVLHELKAGTQNAIILQLFKARPEWLFTPFQVKDILCLDKTPITSIRRAMTTLTDLGYLVKTKTRKMGEYGELNYCWKLKC